METPERQNERELQEQADHITGKILDELELHLALLLRRFLKDNGLDASHYSNEMILQVVLTAFNLRLEPSQEAKNRGTQ